MFFAGFYRLDDIVLYCLLFDVRPRIPSQIFNLDVSNFSQGKKTPSLFRKLIWTKKPLINVKFNTKWHYNSFPPKNNNNRNKKEKKITHYHRFQNLNGPCRLDFSKYLGGGGINIFSFCYNVF